MSFRAEVQQRFGSTDADPLLVSEPNDYVLQAARGEVVPRVPVWLHRQAGRYMTEFRDLRAEYDFFTICRTPELACEVTLQPLRRIPYDAAIIFSDILVIPQAMGMEVEMRPGIGPFFPQPLRHPDQLSELDTTTPVDDSLGYVFEAITLTRKRLGGRIPLIGFAGAPWTLMSYMIEGKGSKTLSEAKKWLYCYPKESKKLLRHIADLVIDYLVGQVRAGAQMLEVFDTWAGFLTQDMFHSFILPELCRIVSTVKSRLQAEGLDVVPVTLFAKGIHYAFDRLQESEFDVLSLDWTLEPCDVRRSFKRTLQGNLDPCALYSPAAAMPAVVQRLVERPRS